MKADLPGISANVLTQRLIELERRGLVLKTRLPPPASVQVYEATAWGLEAAPLIGQLGKWAARSPKHDSMLPISHVSAMLSLRTMLDSARARATSARIGFRFGETSYVGTLDEGQFHIDRGPVGDCDFIFTGTPSELTAIVYAGAPFGNRIEGDLDLARRFVTLFPLPPKAG